MRVTVTNPLPVALAHYEREVRDCVTAMPPSDAPGRWEAIEGLRAVDKAAASVALPVRRLRAPRSDLHLVLWPAFGYWDAATWIRVGRQQPVALIVHDVDPLRAQVGHSRAAHRTFAAAVRAGHLGVVCHTGSAAERLAELTGVDADIVPHPMLEPRPAPAPEQGLVRVLGQHKPARDLAALAELAANLSGGFRMQIWGRGWPSIPGWEVHDVFVDERQFDALVDTSAAIVIPYAAYSQSGVAVRAAERAVPVVGVDHPQVRALYGDDWPGIVRTDRSWSEATEAAIAARPDVAKRVQYSHAAVRTAWTNYLEQVRPR